jgi:hypothetical protein
MKSVWKTRSSATEPSEATYFGIWSSTCPFGSTEYEPYSHPPLRFSIGRIRMNASTAWIWLS